MKTPIKEHIRIIWAILLKDIRDSVKNRMVIGVTIGILFMIISSQALPIILKGYAPIRAYYMDDGRSSTVREMALDGEVQLVQRDNLKDLKTAVGRSAVPVLGLVFPSGFEQSLSEVEPINLEAFTIHWANLEERSRLINKFETALEEHTNHIIRIRVAQQGIYPNPENLGFTSMIITGFVLGVMTVGIFLLPLLMMDEVENKTLDPLRLSPAEPLHILIGKALAGFFFCSLSAILMFSMTWRWIVHLDLAILAVLLGVLNAIGIGLLIGAFSSPSETVNLWAGLALLVLLMPSFLWNLIEPKLNPSVQQLVEVLPSLSMYNILQNAFIQQPAQSEIRTSFLNSMIFSVVLFIVVSYRLRNLNQKG